MRRNRCSILIKLLIIGLFGLVMLAMGYMLLSELATMTNTHYQGLYDEILKPSVKVTTTRGSGSGVIIHHGDTENTIYILTAAHVVGDESTVQVTFYSYRRDAKDAEIEATVIITDTLKDLALLRALSVSAVKSAKLAPRDYTPYIFTPVWVVGCSLGYSPRPTEGRITAVTTPLIPLNKGGLKGLPSLRTGTEGVVWEMNASIWPGNSGGGVFLKSNHQLIGIAVWVRTYQGQLATTMGGIVPLQDIYEFLESYKGLHKVTEGYKKLIRDAQPYATSSNLNSQPVVT